MGTRLELQTLLEQVLGSRNVYFQPPASIKMKYPAIIYSLNDIENRFANDNVYSQSRSYTLTVIDSDPDSEIVSKVSLLPSTRFNTNYVSDNLYHSSFIIYY